MEHIKDEQKRTLISIVERLLSEADAEKSVAYDGTEDGASAVQEWIYDHVSGKEYNVYSDFDEDDGSVTIRIASDDDADEVDKKITLKKGEKIELSDSGVGLAKFSKKAD